MRLQTLLIVLGLFIISYAKAQEFSPSILSPAGDFGYASTMSLEWTLGENAIETNRTGKYIYTEGFHQPILRLELVEIGYKFNDINEQVFPLPHDMEITVTPNPVRSILHVRITSSNQSKVLLQLTDLSGKTILSSIIDPLTNSSDLDFNHYASGLYFLQFIDDAGHLIRTYKVSKIQ